MIFASEQHLIADVIDPRHMLACKRPEVMSQTGTQPCMLVVVFDYMPYIFHAMIFAPFADLI
jgi:hypothetical protein